VRKARKQAKCARKKKCKKPEQLNGKPEQCSPKQIIKCHGDAKKHPCVSTPKALAGGVCMNAWEGESRDKA